MIKTDHSPGIALKGNSSFFSTAPMKSAREKFDLVRSKWAHYSPILKWPKIAQKWPKNGPNPLTAPNLGSFWPNLAKNRRPPCLNEKYFRPFLTLKIVKNPGALWALTTGQNLPIQPRTRFNRVKGLGTPLNLTLSRSGPKKLKKTT